MSSDAKCPFPGHTGTVAGARSNADWWPDQLKLNILHQHSPLSDPMGEGFDYAKEFNSLDLKALKQEAELSKLLPVQLLKEAQELIRKIEEQVK